MWIGSEPFAWSTLTNRKMAREIKDVVSDTTTSTGIGQFTLLGVIADAGSQTVATAHTTGSTIRYNAFNAGRSEWEVGEGIWTSGTNILTRVTVFASSNANALVNFSAGTKNIYCVVTATDIATITEVEIDFGTLPVTGKRFSITDVAITATKKIMILPSGNVATGRVGDDWDWDTIIFTAKAGAGNFALTAKVPRGRIRGKRKVFYTYL